MTLCLLRVDDHRGHRGAQRKFLRLRTDSERYRAYANNAQRRSGCVRARGTGEEDARPPANLIA